MNRLALVTGSSRGIGAAVARELLARGWRVVGVARGDAAPGLPSPRNHGQRYHHEHLDLADLAALEAWCEGPFRERFAPESAARLGLVNNAGVLQPVAPATDLCTADLAANLAVNVVAPAWLAGFFARVATSGAALRVVNVSSGAATKAYAGWTAYCAAKAALRMAGNVLAEDAQAYPRLAGLDLAVVGYAPHVVETAMQEELRALDDEDFPLRGYFADLKASGALVAPEGPAGEIADLLERDGLPPYSEMRYAP